MVILFPCSGKEKEESHSQATLISIVSLTFIIGIPKQIKTMFAPGNFWPDGFLRQCTQPAFASIVRFWATVTYIVLLILTLAMSIWVWTTVLQLILWKVILNLSLHSIVEKLCVVHCLGLYPVCCPCLVLVSFILDAISSSTRTDISSESQSKLYTLRSRNYSSFLWKLCNFHLIWL